MSETYPVMDPDTVETLKECVRQKDWARFDTVTEKCPGPHHQAGTMVSAFCVVGGMLKEGEVTRDAALELVQDYGRSHGRAKPIQYFEEDFINKYQRRRASLPPYTVISGGKAEALLKRLGG